MASTRQKQIAAKAAKKKAAKVKKLTLTPEQKKEAKKKAQEALFLKKNEKFLAQELTINATNADGTKTPMVFTIKTLVHRVIHLTHSIDQLNLFTLSMARSFYKQVPGDKFFETCDKDFMDKLKDSTENPLDLLRAHQDAASKGTVEPNSSPRTGDPEHLEIPFPEAKKG